MKIPKGARQLPDGVIAFPKRGNPPQPGYPWMPTADPYIFEIYTCDCEHRTTIPAEANCKCKRQARPFCTFLDLEIDKLTCHLCNGNPEVL